MRLKVYILFNEYSSDRQLYEIDEQLEYKDSDYEIVIYSKFKTDLVSSPRLLWSLVPPTGRWAYAAIFHDFLYRSALVSRKEADIIFLRIMKKTGVSITARYSAFLAVRLFGWYNYKNKIERKYGYVNYIKK